MTLMDDGFTVPADWYRSFFTAAVNLFWETMVPDAATAADIAFVRRHVAPPPAHLLDVPCGAGRHTLALARAGYRVTAIDLSEEAISRARAAGKGLTADFRRGDMRSLELDECFDGILCLGNSLSYFPPGEMRAFVASLAARVAVGGRLILDTSCCAESLFPLAGEREIAFEGGTYSSIYGYDARRSLLKTKAELTLGEEVHLLRYAHYVVTSGELVRMVEDAGLRVDGLYGGTEDEVFAPGMPRLLLVASG
jgi:2-polyprenyl-3-methyl-5-hydroxy-6-metoxy-1,4-benzoquinol methylase